MKLKKIPPLLISILDANLSVATGLRNELESTLPAASFGRAFEFRVFNKSSDAKEVLRRAKAGSFEPCLFVSDTIGFEPPGRGVASSIRPMFPHARIVLHSEGATDNLEFVGGLLAGDCIDVFIPKSDPESVSKRLLHEFDNYLNRSCLRTMGHYVSSVCNDPTEPFFEVDGRHLNMLDIYWAIVTGSSIASECEGVWNTLLLARM